MMPEVEVSDSRVRERWHKDAVLLMPDVRTVDV